jgi:hypothetical protein
VELAAQLNVGTVFLKRTCLGKIIAESRRVGDRRPCLARRDLETSGPCSGIFLSLFFLFLFLSQSYGDMTHLGFPHLNLFGNPRLGSLPTVLLER